MSSSVFLSKCTLQAFERVAASALTALAVSALVVPLPNAVRQSTNFQIR